MTSDGRRFLVDAGLALALLGVLLAALLTWFVSGLLPLGARAGGSVFITAAAVVAVCARAAVACAAKMDGAAPLVATPWLRGRR